MKVFVLITAVLELLAGALMLFAPRMIPDLAGADAGSISFARMYGAAAIAMGFFAFQTWQHMRSPIIQNAFLQTFLVFHIGVAAAGYVAYSSATFKDMNVAILHGAFAIVTAYFYFKKRQAAAETA